MSPGVVFLVGTGRCGSQMLGRFLATHPRILYVNELISTLRAAEQGRLPRGEMDGPALWRTLSRPGTFFEDYLDGRVPPPRPLIAQKVLRSLPSFDGDLLEQLASEINTWSRSPAPALLSRLLGFLAFIFDRDIVVERSGSSVTKVSMIEDAFPNSRYVHLVRRGADCALSMSKHPGFRLGELIDHLVETVRSAEGLRSMEVQDCLPNGGAGLLEPPYDIDLIQGSAVPLERFGRLWSEMISDGAAQLRALDRDHVHTVAYEDVLSAVDDSLAAIASFVDIPADAHWLETVRDMVRADRAGSARAELTAVALRELEIACSRGEQVLALGVR